MSWRLTSPEREADQHTFFDADNFRKPDPAEELTLEGAWNSLANECVEVTPRAIRNRKVILDSNERVRYSAAAPVPTMILAARTNSALATPPAVAGALSIRRSRRYLLGKRGSGVSA